MRCRICHREYEVDDFTDESEACEDVCPDCLYSGNMYGPEYEDYEYMDPDGDDPYDDDRYEDTPQEETYEELLDDVEVPEDEEFDD